jgi:hypothetical protein
VTVRRYETQRTGCQQQLLFLVLNFVFFFGQPLPPLGAEFA